MTQSNVDLTNWIIEENRKKTKLEAYVIMSTKAEEGERGNEVTLVLNFN